jgi:phosphoribosylformimino-5-aminoimidazole carboxamide ribonucleotide (ProFAR) isomerase
VVHWCNKVVQLVQSSGAMVQCSGAMVHYSGAMVQLGGGCNDAMVRHVYTVVQCGVTHLVLGSTVARCIPSAIWP